MRPSTWIRPTLLAPPTRMTELYPEQLDAISRMKNGCILKGGTGSGKSITSIGYYFLKVCGGKSEHGDISPMTNPRDLYIITPATKRDKLEWDKELSHFLLSRNQELCLNGVKVVVDSWNNIQKYVNVVGAFFIFDEQRLRGYGVWAKSFFQIAKKNKWVMLTATPGDSWRDYMSVFIANGFYKNKSEFDREHVVYNPYVKFPQVKRYVNVQKLIRLRDDITVSMADRRETVRHIVTVPIGYNKDLYMQVLEERWNPFKNEPVKNVSELYALFRRISNGSEERANVAKEYILEYPKLIVFYNFDYELEALRDITSSLGIPTAEWNGHKHMPIPKGNRWVYLVQYTSGSEAWNCIETNVVLFYSLNYSWWMFEQAQGRIDRIDTTYRDLYYFVIESEAPIDKRIRRAIDQKEDFNETEDARKAGYF